MNNPFEGWTEDKLANMYWAAAFQCVHYNDPALHDAVWDMYRNDNHLAYLFSIYEHPHFKVDTNRHAARWKSARDASKSREEGNIPYTNFYRFLDEDIDYDIVVQSLKRYDGTNNGFSFPYPVKGYALRRHPDPRIFKLQPKENNRLNTTLFFHPDCPDTFRLEYILTYGDPFDV